MRLLYMLLSLPVLAMAVETLVWSDEFNKLDFTKWQHEISMGGGGNWEFQYYTNNRSNSYVKNSVLYLKPTLTASTIGEANVASGYTMDLWGSSPADECTGNKFYGCTRTSGINGGILNPIQSARLRTVNSFNFKYGRVEIRAKLPRGDWLWPAIWMLPRHNAYGQWPASGEIDIVESRGNANYLAGEGLDSFLSTLHWGPFFPENKYKLTQAAYTLPANKLFSDDFHVFGLIWTETSIKTYIDSVANVVLNVDFTQSSSMWEKGGWNSSSFENPWVSGGRNAPFDEEFYLILNLAVGGTGGYFDDKAPNKPWLDSDPLAMKKFWDAKASWYPTWNGENAAMQVDYVRVYQNTP